MTYMKKRFLEANLTYRKDVFVHHLEYSRDRISTYAEVAALRIERLCSIVILFDCKRRLVAR